MNFPKPIRCKLHGKTYYRLDLRPLGMGQKFSRTKDKLEKWITDNYLTIQKFGTRGAMDDGEFTYLLACRDEAAKLQVPIMEALRFWKDHAQRLVEKPLDEAVYAFMEAKAQQNIRPAYAKTLGWLMDNFLAFFGTDRVCHTISFEHIMGWAGTQNWNLATKRRMLNCISAFFRFCGHESRRWVMQNPMSAMEPIFVDRKKPRIITVEQCKTLLAAGMADREMLPYLTVQMFGGLRCDETMDRLTPDHFKPDFIDLEEDTAKTREQRMVPINDTLRAWLEYQPFRIVEHRRNERWTRIRKAIVWPQRNSVLRHTAATMLLHKYGEVKAAMWLGHSESTLQNKYRGRVTDPAQVDLFWGLKPGEF